MTAGPGRPAAEQVQLTLRGAHPFHDRARETEMCASQAEGNASEASAAGRFLFLERPEMFYVESHFELGACRLFG